MDRRIAWTSGLLLLQVAVLWATYWIPGLGEQTWHNFASLGVALAVSAVFWRPLARSRRFLAMGVLSLTVLATASGFWLLYWKEGLRVDGLQDWGRFWHILWSWFAAIFFFQHSWINRAALVSFVRRTVSTLSGSVLHAGAYALVVVAFIVMWFGTGKTWVTNDNYIPLSLYTWLVFSVPPYLIWLYVRTGLRFPLSQDRVKILFARRRVQVWFTVALVPMAALAVLSGLPLAFTKDFVENVGLKYIAKYWHVWPSVLFAVLVFGHSIHSWASVKLHWRALAKTPRTTRAPLVDPETRFPGAGAHAPQAVHAASRSGQAKPRTRR